MEFDLCGSLKTCHFVVIRKHNFVHIKTNVSGKTLWTHFSYPIWQFDTLLINYRLFVQHNCARFM